MAGLRVLIQTFLPNLPSTTVLITPKESNPERQLVQVSSKKRPQSSRGLRRRTLRAVLLRLRTNRKNFKKEVIRR